MNKEIKNDVLKQVIQQMKVEYLTISDVAEKLESMRVCRIGFDIDKLDTAIENLNEIMAELDSNIEGLE